MHKSYDEQLRDMVTLAFDKWYAEQVEKHRKEAEIRKFNASMHRIFMRYKKVNTNSQYVIDSVYTYSSVGALTR